MTSRIGAKFADLKTRGECALVAYIMAGYPDMGTTEDAVAGLVKGGADIIELGFPFSDPLADGPVIQNASTASLARGTTTKQFFGMARKIRRQTDVPLVVMTYSNVAYQMGYEEFVSKTKAAGMDGAILPDMPVEESAEYLKHASGRIDAIFLASPNTPKQRIQRIASVSSGFLYMVAVYGTTGTTTGVKDYAVKAVRNTKRIVGGRIPVGVGFGVSTPDDVRSYVRAGADAVIVGSALLRAIEKTPRSKVESRMASLAKSLKNGTKLS